MDRVFVARLAPLRHRSVLEIRSWVRERLATYRQTWSFLLAIGLCGLFFGTIVAHQLSPTDNAVLVQNVKELLLAVAHRQLASTSQLWWQRVVLDEQLLALFWLFGLSVVGLPLVIVTLFLRSFSTGFAIGFTVLQFGWKGLWIALFGVAVHQFAALLVLIAAGSTAVRFSAGILKQSYTVPRLAVLFFQYTGWMMVCGTGLAAIALMQSYLGPSLLYAMFGGG